MLEDMLIVMIYAAPMILLISLGRGFDVDLREGSHSLNRLLGRHHRQNDVV